MTRGQHKHSWCSVLWRACLSVVLICIGGDRLVGFSYFAYGASPIVWPGSQAVRYLSPSTFPPDSEPDILVRAAMGTWNLAPATGFSYSFSRLEQDYEIDNFDGFSDTAAVPAGQLDPGVIGVTTLVNDGASWFDADIVFSDSPGGGAGYTFDPFPTCEVVAEPVPSNGYSFFLVALHELGHGLGLGHDPAGTEPEGSPWFVGTMNPRYPSGGTMGQHDIIELHTDDRNATRFLYPHTGPSDPPMTDLGLSMFSTGGAVGGAVPLLVEPRSAPPGAEVLVRSVIENLGVTSLLFVRQGFYLSADGVIDVDDAFLGAISWDVGFGDALEVDIAVELPADFPAGPYYLGSIIDDLNELEEAYEDNNAARYCEPLTVEQLAPAMATLPQQRATCGAVYRSPAPELSHPENMRPIVWSLDNPEPGTTIDASTGVIEWLDPEASPFLYTLLLRATNLAGTTAQTVFLGVESLPPAMVPMRDTSVRCDQPYTGRLPFLTAADCMSAGLYWTLDERPTGMTVDAHTGVVRWSAPVSSPEPYVITLRATNSAGTSADTWLLTVREHDLDGNGAVALPDAALMVGCLSGPGGALGGGCACSDADADGDIDLADIASFQAAFGW